MAINFNDVLQRYLKNCIVRACFAIGEMIGCSSCFACMKASWVNSFVKKGYQLSELYWQRQPG